MTFLFQNNPATLKIFWYLEYYMVEILAPTVIVKHFYVVLLKAYLLYVVKVMLSFVNAIFL